MKRATFFPHISAANRNRLPCVVATGTQQEYYTFPDVALCTTFGKGCLDYDNDCFEDFSFTSMFNQTVSNSRDLSASDV